MNIIDKLQVFPVLKNFTTKEINYYLSVSTFHISNYSKNEVISYCGDICDKIQIILSGTIGFEKIDDNGKVHTIAVHKPGNFIGGNILFSSQPNYTMNIVSKTPSELLVIKRENLFDLLKRNPIILRSYLEYTSDYGLLFRHKLMGYVGNSLRSKLLHYLQEEYYRQKSSHILLKSSKTKLAETFGVQRTSLSRELKKMKLEGLILFNATTIIITALGMQKIGLSNEH